MKQIIKTFGESQAEFRPGDLVLYTRGNKPSNIAIARLSGSPFVHAAMLECWANRWSLLETLQWEGCRRVPLLDQVKAYPGQWHHFKANPDNRWPEWDRADAVAYARSQLDQPYGWRALIYATLRQAPFVRVLFSPNTDDDCCINGYLPFCSHYYANAVQVGGVDMVPLRQNRLVVPGMLANSLFVRHKCAVVPNG